MNDEILKVINKVRKDALEFWGDDALRQSILYSERRATELGEFILEYVPEGRRYKILEVGTFRGISAAFMAMMGGSDVEITTIGLRASVEHSELLKFWAKVGVGEKITFEWVMDDVDKVQKFMGWRGRSYDLILIDGEHTFSGVCLDFALCRSLITEGIIIFDDIRFSGVEKFIARGIKYYQTERKFDTIGFKVEKRIMI